MFEFLASVAFAAVMVPLAMIPGGSVVPPEPNAGSPSPQQLGPIANALIVDWGTMVCSAIGVLMYSMVFTNIRSLIVA